MHGEGGSYKPGDIVVVHWDNHLILGDIWRMATIHSVCVLDEGRAAELREKQKKNIQAGNTEVVLLDSDGESFSIVIELYTVRKFMP